MQNIMELTLILEFFLFILERRQFQISAEQLVESASANWLEL